MPTRSSPRPAPATRAAKQRKARAAEPEVDRFDFQSDSLGYTLRRAQVRAYELYFAMLGALDLTPARVTALSIIAMEPDIGQAALAKRLDIAGPSALKLVDALEAAGLICRMDVAGDRRRYSLGLTGEGKSRLEALRTELAVYEKKLASGLSAAERTQLMAMLERVAA